MMLFSLLSIIGYISTKLTQLRSITMYIAGKDQHPFFALAGLYAGRKGTRSCSVF